MKKIYSIGEMSNLFNTSVSKLRYYDDVDLFKAKVRDASSGYRYYGIDQFEELSMILYLKSTGLSLKNIKKLLHDKTPNKIEEGVYRHLTDIKEKIKTYQIIEKRLEKVIDQLDRSSATGFHIKEFKDRRYNLMSLSDLSTESMDLNLRKLSNKQDVFTGRFGMCLSLKEVLAGCIEKNLFLESDEGNRMFPAGKYLVFRYKGRHLDSYSYYKDIYDYALTHHLELEDLVIEVTLINHAYTQTYDDYVTEIQIKIRA